MLLCGTAGRAARLPPERGDGRAVVREREGAAATPELQRLQGRTAVQSSVKGPAAWQKLPFCDAGLTFSPAVCAYNAPPLVAAGRSAAAALGRALPAVRRRPSPERPNLRGREEPLGTGVSEAPRGPRCGAARREGAGGGAERREVLAGSSSREKCRCAAKAPPGPPCVVRSGRRSGGALRCATGVAGSCARGPLRMLPWESRRWRRCRVALAKRGTRWKSC